MRHEWYVLSTTVHVLAAMIWVGGMLFMTLMLIPALRALRDPPLMGRLIEEVGRRFKWIGWGCLLTLLVTGFTNLTARGVSHATLAQRDFWASDYGGLLLGKIGLFAGIVLLSVVHDTVVGPRYRVLRRTAPQDPSVERFRMVASWAGRVTLVLSLMATVFGVMLVRGRLW